jgi:hypothetical protein
MAHAVSESIERENAPDLLRCMSPLVALSWQIGTPARLSAFSEKSRPVLLNLSISA